MEKQKLLVALDEHSISTEVVKYLGRIISGKKDLEVCLLHMLAPLPPELREFRGLEDPKAEEAFMFVLSVDLRIKPENVDAFTAKAIENAADSRKEPGCRQFDVLVDPKDRTKLMLYEVYADEKAFEAHKQTAHFKKYAAEAVPLLASRERHMWRRAAP